ncbi:hypothetical protein AMK68_03245 [candidate division KD3-62 bacterium DG_56]|uniref:Uroporphyrinogen decarboxylase (URO-D) domain-containing protein n=1 Tax=candidate division KD3-62 bacterium DG_56 TaxID=1704032 RepID=A0A0S7XMV9_9BACT|nr:MAG: hypothetical protein AMK68_03245 [candidate division KD3-62 bacterium DG_56]
MKPRNIVLEQIHHRATTPIPFTLGFEQGVAERVDEFYGSTDWRQKIPPYMVRVSTIDEDRRVALDETHYRDAFGSVWSTAGRPFHLDQPGLRSPSFENYAFPEADIFIDAERGQQALEQCRRYADSFLVARFGWGLFERSWNLRGFQEVLVDVVAAPDFFEELLDRITDLHLKFIEASARLPVDGIMFSDDWGDQRGVIIGPERWRRFLKPRLAKLYQAAHGAGKLTLSHCCGSVAEIMPDIIEIGLDVLESVQPEARGMDPYGLKRRWGDKITFWGGLGSQSTIPFGTRQHIFDEVKHLCEEMPRGGGYILSPAKSLQPETPTENAVAVLEAFLTFTGHDG